MSRPGGSVPRVIGRVVKSAVTVGPFWKIGEGILVEEAKVVVKQFGGQLSNLNLQCAAHNRFVFL